MEVRANAVGGSRTSTRVGKEVQPLPSVDMDVGIWTGSGMFFWMWLDLGPSEGNYGSMQAYELTQFGPPPPSYRSHEKLTFGTELTFHSSHLSPTCVALLRTAMMFYGSLSLASLASVLLPDALRPLLYALYALLSLANLHNLVRKWYH
ncbi:hypothetical protein AAG906_028011 [Vitis piasezkii]